MCKNTTPARDGTNFFYFQDTGVLIFGGMYFRGGATNSKFQHKLKGYLFSEGYLFTGFYGICWTRSA